MATRRLPAFSRAARLAGSHLGASPTLVTDVPPLSYRMGSPGWPPRRHPPGVQDSYLVDSASSHMLVSKIKPCMSKYKQLYRETANGSLNQLSFI
jgi:hypothetical protein